MSERYKVIEHDQPNFITLTIVGWVDLFVRTVYTKILEWFAHINLNRPKK